MHIYILFCFSENVTKYYITVAVFGIIILILLGLLVYKCYKKSDNKKGKIKKWNAINYDKSNRMSGTGENRERVSSFFS